MFNELKMTTVTVTNCTNTDRKNNNLLPKEHNIKDRKYDVGNLGPSLGCAHTWRGCLNNISHVARKEILTFLLLFSVKRLVIPGCKHTFINR